MNLPVKRLENAPALTQTWIGYVSLAGTQPGKSVALQDSSQALPRRSDIEIDDSTYFIDERFAVQLFLGPADESNLSG
jgi:hypothetical protein